MHQEISRRQWLQRGAGAALAAGLTGSGVFATEAAQRIREFRRGGMRYRRLAAR